MANPTDQLTIRGAREHNLKNVTFSIPRDRLVVFTGLSGSGKSSLAFDTIYAEGQRRYVESLSAYARQFLGQMEKQTVEQMADQVERFPTGTRLLILGPVVRGRKGEYERLLEDIRRQGFSRVRVDGQMYELGEKVPLERYKQHDIEVVVDRLVVGPEQRTRLGDSLEIAAKVGQGG